MSNEQRPAIAVQNLQKAFGKQRVLNGITFEVRPGETVAVIGRSGGGKERVVETAHPLAGTRFWIDPHCG